MDSKENNQLLLENCENALETVDKSLRYLNIIERCLLQAVMSNELRQRDIDILNNVAASMNKANIGHNLSSFREHVAVYKEQDRRTFLVDNPVTGSLPEFVPKIFDGTLQAATEEEKLLSPLSCVHGIGLCKECGCEGALKELRKERSSLRSLREDLLRQRRYLNSL
jgi:hypothetical protein